MGAGGHNIWKKRCEPLQAANFGIGEQNMMQILWRITAGGELDDINSKVVVFMAGTNNIGMHNVEQIADALRVSMNTIRQKLPRTRILLPGILLKVVEAGNRREKVRTVNVIIFKLENTKSVRYIDISDRFLLPNGELNQELMPDGTHSNAKGYEACAEAMEPLLDEMLK